MWTPHCSWKSRSEQAMKLKSMALLRKVLNGASIVAVVGPAVYLASQSPQSSTCIDTISIVS